MYVSCKCVTEKSNSSHFYQLIIVKMTTMTLMLAMMVILMTVRAMTMMMMIAKLTKGLEGLESRHVQPHQVTLYPQST